jgi:hypothetical protein
MVSDRRFWGAGPHSPQTITNTWTTSRHFDTSLGCGQPRVTLEHDANSRRGILVVNVAVTTYYLYLIFGLHCSHNFTIRRTSELLISRCRCPLCCTTDDTFSCAHYKKQNTKHQRHFSAYCLYATYLKVRKRLQHSCVPLRVAVGLRVHPAVEPQR